MILRLTFGVVFATYFLWQLPFSATAQVRLPEIAAAVTFPESAITGDKPVAAVFYRRTGAGQYRIFGLDAGGAITRTLSLPGEQVKKADETSVSFTGKEGYITAPENGAYFVWYPQIGQQVYVFNEQGSFLWEKDESHYLQVLPRGRFIMAAAGDHSRLIFLNPDFKTQADFQGVLFTRYLSDDNPDLVHGQVCLGSLDGEIIIAHIDRKIYLRQKLGYALKSLVCNFDSGELAAIVERTVTEDKVSRQIDFLIRARFSLKQAKDDKPVETMRQLNQEIDIQGTIAMPVRTVMASPMVLADDSVCFIQAAPVVENNAAAGEALALYYTQGAKNKLYHVVIGEMTAAGAADYSPDLWKSAALPLQNGSACIFAHRSGKLLVANRLGLLLTRNDLPVERIVAQRNAAFLQTAKGILTLR